MLITVCVVIQCNIAEVLNLQLSNLLHLLKCIGFVFNRKLQMK